MRKAVLFLLINYIISIVPPVSTGLHKELNANNNMIHFIKTGSSDSILIESNGRYGLVDTGNPYKNIEHEVEHVQIDESKGEVNQWTTDPDQSVQAVIDYLGYLKVNKLDFIIGTHAHSDHIGGVPAVAYYYVDENTKYYYREYRETREDTTQVDWANYKYYLAAVHSMQIKGAQLVDVTNQNVHFDFGDMHIELLNTDIDPDELNLGENQNSIVTLITFQSTKILLAADMIAKDDQKLKDYVGKIDVLKLAHHGYSESSYDFLKVTKPDNIVITNSKIIKYANQIINYLKYSLGSKVYMTEYVSKSSKSIPNSAIKLNLKGGSPQYEFINTGKEVEPDPSVNGWSSWYDKWTYLVDGKTVKKWNYLEWSQGKNMFYFDEDGIMVVGWQKLEWDGGINWFYFYPENGSMAQNCCITIDGKEYCFDENGCLIE